LGQVAHLDLATPRTTDTVRDAINAHLKPQPIAILSAEQVGEGFDARFSARRRHYLYRLTDRRAPLALDRGRLWWVAQPLDEAAMHEAAQALVGNHDFTTFRSSECQAKSPVKTLDSLDVTRERGEVIVRATARSFLHNQVRSMVGALKKVGEGKWPVAAVGEALSARDRARSGPVAPPDGLYLVAVDY
jgi:tRNA pseudouridine38-40 synthase